jgi:hypothetical protein
MRAAQMKQILPGVLLLCSCHLLLPFSAEPTADSRRADSDAQVGESRVTDWPGSESSRLLDGPRDGQPRGLHFVHLPGSLAGILVACAE